MIPRLLLGFLQLLVFVKMIHMIHNELGFASDLACWTLAAVTAMAAVCILGMKIEPDRPQMRKKKPNPDNT